MFTFLNAPDVFVTPGIINHVPSHSNCIFHVAHDNFILRRWESLCGIGCIIFFSVLSTTPEIIEHL
jgi:hypothetical protein